MADDDEPLTSLGERAAGVAGFLVACVLGLIALDMITGGAISGLFAGAKPEGGGCADC